MGCVGGVCGACAGRVQGVCGACAGCVCGGGACGGWAVVERKYRSPLYYPDTLVNLDTCLGLFDLGLLICSLKDRLDVVTSLSK